MTRCIFARKRKCPTCHGFGFVVDKDMERKPCYNPNCKDGWIEE